MSNSVLINADCLEAMQDIPNDSVDLVVTSPPYDNLRTYNDSLEWSFEIFQNIAKELKRILKPGGVIVWVVGDTTVKGSETGTSFKQALYFKEIGLNLHDTMIWTKDGGGAIGSRYTYTQNTEYMFIVTKGTPQHLNLLVDKPNLSAGKTRNGVGRRKKDGTFKVEIRKPAADFSKRNNHWYIPVQKQKEAENHPAVFPLQLALDHIISWSNPGDVILDPFLGSGTTGVASVNLNRRFIGIEKEEKYFEIATKRIAEAEEKANG